MSSSLTSITFRNPTSGHLQLQDSLADFFGAGPWVIVSPHDDDLVLGMGMTIAAAVAEGIQVHALIVSDGRMGYADPSHKATIVATRKSEALQSLAELGIKQENVHFMGLPDGALVLHAGCNRKGTGLGQQLTAMLRRIQSTVVFGPTPRDLHPDHRVTSRELDMACCWAGSDIWREMGAVLPPVKRFNYAVYCPFPEPPEVQICGISETFETKMRALRAFESQGSITNMVARLQEDGPYEYFHEAHWEPYRPTVYAELFEPPRAKTFGSLFRADCMEVNLLLSHWTPKSWPPLEDALQLLSSKPLVLVAEGSSRLFPGSFLNHLLRQYGHACQVHVMGGREAAKTLDHVSCALLLSNSGETKELVDFVQLASRNTQLLGIIGREGSQLENLILETVLLPGPEERVVPATTSVFAQCLILGLSAAKVCGHDLPLHGLRSAVAEVLSAPLPSRFHAGIACVERLWWADGGDGVASELALKTMETTGLPGHGISGNLLIHGIEETLGPFDLVIWYNPPKEDKSRIAQLVAHTKAHLICVGDETCDWDLPELGVWNPLVHLVTGWRILDEVARVINHDPDEPKRIRKVGNPAD